MGQAVAEAFLIFTLGRRQRAIRHIFAKNFPRYSYSLRISSSLSHSTFSSQGSSARWHCAARREIAERSEEAPGAKAAQPSSTCGSWKTPAGCFGGDARGAEKGAQLHNRPRLAARRVGGPKTTVRKKPPCPRGTFTSTKRQAKIKNNAHTQRAHTISIQSGGDRWHCAARREIAERSEEAPAARAAQPSWSGGNGKAPAGCFGGDARGAEKGAQPHNRPRLAARRVGGPNNSKKKAPVPAGHRNCLSKDKPCFVFFRAPAPQPCTSPLSRRRSKQQGKKAF